MLYRYEHTKHSSLQIQTSVKTKAVEKTGITEIVLPSTDSLGMILPTLAYLSRSQDNSNKKARWLTWFPPIGFHKSALANYGFDLSKVRFVYPKDDEHCYWLFWEALAEGNSHTVVASPGRLSENQVSRLEHASHVGECSGLVLRTRTHH